MSVELKLPVTLGLIAAAFAVPIGVQAATGGDAEPLPVAKAIPTPTPTPTPTPAPGRVSVALAPGLRKGAALPALRDPRRPHRRRARRHYIAPSPQPVFTSTPDPSAAPPPPPTFVPTRQPTVPQRPAATPAPTHSGTFDTTGEP